MSDFFERARSTGFIGVAVIIFMLIGFGSLFLMVFDDRLNGENSAKLRDNVREQEFELYSLEDEVDWAGVKLLEQKRIEIVSKELGEAHKIIDVLTRKETELTTQIEKEKMMIKAVGEEQIAYREEYREFVRSEAVGDTFDELVLTGGKKLTNLKIREVLPDKIRFTTQFGTTAATWEELPEEWRERFQVGEGELEEHKAKLDAIQAQRNQMAVANQANRGVRLREMELRKSLGRIDSSLKTKNKSIDSASIRLVSLRNKAKIYRAKVAETGLGGNKIAYANVARKADAEASTLDAKIRIVNKQIADLDREKSKLERAISDLKEDR